MSDGDKTEQPTPKKLRDARKKGQVANSKEVVSAAGIVSVFAYFWVMMPYYMQRGQELLLIPTGFYEMPFRDALSAAMQLIFNLAVELTLPVVGIGLLAGILGNFFQVGVLFSFESLKPDLKKINPAEGVKKIFNMKSVIEMLKSIFKIAFLSVLLYMVIRDGIRPLLLTPYCGMDCFLSMTGELLSQVMIYTVAAFIIIAAADFAWQRKQHTKSLMMTKDEIKREYKESEGDPTVKGQRKQFHQEMIMGGGPEPKVKKSTAVVTNPTHLAVGLRYQRGETPLPMVMIKGRGVNAEKIKKIAEAEGIPIFENVPLARALMESAEVNQYIPPDLIEPVAEVLRAVQALKAQQQAESGSGL